MQEEKRTQYVEEIIKNSETELPEILIDEEVSHMMSEFAQQLQPMGMTIDQYLSQLKKDKKELEKDWRPQAEKSVISALAIKQIAKDQEIKVTSEEIEAESNKTLQYYKNVKDMEKNIDIKRLYTYSNAILENEKVFEYLEKL